MTLVINSAGEGGHGDAVSATEQAASSRVPVMRQESRTGTDAEFDDLAALAAGVAGVSTALICVFQGERLWFRGRVGTEHRYAPRRGSLCSHVVANDDELVLDDVSGDGRFCDHPAVTGEFGLHFFAGFPLRMPAGEIAGVLCVASRERVELGDRQRHRLRVLARQAVAQLELRHQSGRAATLEAQLTRVEARYRQLAVRQFAEAQALARLGSWEWDLVADHTTWSPEMFRIFGLDPAAQHGVPPTADRVLQLIHPVDRGRCLVLVRTVLASAGRTNYQMRTLGADGSERHAEGWVETEQDAVTGRTVRAWGTLQDVTERVAREAALAETEQRLRLTIETSPVGFALIALDGRWVEANEAMARIVGYSRERLMQFRFQDITHPDDLAPDLALLAKLEAGEISSYQLDKRYLHSSGRVVWVSLTASVVRRADGSALHYVAQVEDITERRLALAELQSERDLSAALLGALHDGYAYLERGRIIVVNDVFCEMTGRTREELTGTARFPLFGPQAVADGAALRDLINFREGNVEVPMNRSDGSQFEAAIQLRPVRRPDGRVSGYVALVRDITDHKQHERRLRHRADHDGLTGLLNPTAFHQRLTEAIGGTRESGNRLSVAILDLDGFKAVNDTFGHQAGDTVLTEFADRLRGNARGDDIIGRIGGEEFGWAMRDTDREEALGALNRTLEAVRRYPFSHVGRLTFSAGLVELGPQPKAAIGPAEAFDGGETAFALIGEADQMLYAAKASGRDRIIAATREG